MKITDFGLWFECRNSSTNNLEWSSVPLKGSSRIFISYDGEWLGRQNQQGKLVTYSTGRHIIALVPRLHSTYYESTIEAPGYCIDRLISLDDFKIVENPDYRGAE
jgi:hypothetical protein